jgi:2'-5' RNA ligase
MKRLFIACPITLSEDNILLQNNLKKATPYDQIVWVNPEWQHITLRFLGKTPDNLIAPTIELMEEIAKQITPFTLKLNKLGIFGSRYQPRVIWLGFEEFTPFRDMFNLLEPKLLDLGYEKNYGNVVPHLTLGRIKKIDNKKNFFNLIESTKITDMQEVKFERLILFQSRLTPQGPRYTPLETVVF